MQKIAIMNSGTKSVRKIGGHVCAKPSSTPIPVSEQLEISSPTSSPSRGNDGQEADETSTAGFSQKDQLPSQEHLSRSRMIPAARLPWIMEEQKFSFTLYTTCTDDPCFPPLIFTRETLRVTSASKYFSLARP